MPCKTLDSDEYKSLIWQALAEFPALLITAFIIDIIGRKATFLIATGIFTVSLFPLLLSCEIGKYWANILLICSRGSSLAWNSCLYVYTPENYPTEIRALSLGTGSTFMRIGVMITPFIAQVLMAYSVALGAFAYIAVGALSLIHI